MSLPRDVSLYNGVSNRSRGWKSKKSDKAMEGHISSNPGIRRWDGASRSSTAWDNLRRDPDLWFRDGDCYVHLYGKGQSRRGPAFKVPLSVLLEANCYPLVDHFVSRDVIELSSASPPRQGSDAYYRRLSKQNRVELYIPAPHGSDKLQSFNFHLATRNFFAWVFRRSLVGEHLGTALITLMDSLHEFRTRDVDNVADLMSYMDEEGYLDLKSQPSHALAMLHLAEVFQLRDLYIDSFAHCCGMSDQLFLGPEYQLVSSVTRKLLRRTRVEMDLKLGQMGSMLRTFLQDELSEAHLGLYPGARAHLERFRTVLHGFYANKFGYYPPPSIDPRTTIFEVDVFRTMRTDFEALFNYLVDATFDTSQSIPIQAQGGICILQSVQSFDTRYKFDTLVHPLPLLPEELRATSSRRMSWLGKGVQSKLGPSQRAHAHVALLKATNQSRIELLNNDLVRAYRKFEEDSIYAPLRADKLENLTMVDSRKVRWILIYAVYQTLRHATEPPSEVKEAGEVPYNLCISTTKLPPWTEERTVQSLVRKQTVQITRNPSTSTAGWTGSSGYLTPPMSPATPIEIKPDVDYFALTHREEQSTQGKAGSNSNRHATIPPRRTSIGGGLPLNGPVRRSLSIFTRHTPEKTKPDHQRKGSQYHEIVVHGYGNGTNEVEFTSQEQQQQSPSSSSSSPTTATPTSPTKGVVMSAATKTTTSTTMRSPSTSSNSSALTDGSNSEINSASTADTSVTGDTSITESITTTASTPTPKVVESPSTPRHNHHHNNNLDLPQWPSVHQSLSVRGRVRTSPGCAGTPPQALSIHGSPLTPTRRSLNPYQLQPPSSPSPSGSRRRSRSLNRGRDYRKSMEPLPLQIRKVGGAMHHRLADVDDDSRRMVYTSHETTTPAVWDDIKRIMAVRNSTLAGVDDIKPHWDFYNDLGGLTEPKGGGGRGS